MEALIAGSILMLPLAAFAQVSGDLPRGGESEAAIQISGIPTIDIITLRGVSPSIPLRFGSVVPNSETIEFEGKKLRKGTDYHIDYGAGVIYLMRVQREGQSLRVVYRYDREQQSEKVQGSQFAGMPPMKFDLMPGTSAVMGFGMTERLADGNVLTSNIYGLNNNFSMSGANLTGFLLFGERNQVDNRSGFEHRDAPGQTETGRSRLVLQNLKSNMLGGTFEASYQDISQNFTGFQSLQGSGYDQSALEQLQKERGLQRMGFAFSGLQFGDTKISNSYRNVRDADGGIDWRTVGIEHGSLSLNYESRRIDQNFKRFKDLAENDREQLRKEAGLSRERLEAKAGGLSFRMNQIEDTQGEGIYQREFKFDSGRFQLTAGDQEINEGFTRFQHLAEGERGQWQKEAGLRRQHLSMQAAITGRDNLSFRFAKLESKDGTFQSRDLNVGGKGWGIEHIVRQVDPSFTSLRAMSEGEMDSHIKSIASMYQPGGVPTRPQDRGAFLQSQGLSRSLTRFTVEPFKDWKLNMDTMSLKGQEDSARVDTFSLLAKNFEMNFRHQSLGERFSELSSLMEFERQRLGAIAGLTRTDFGLQWQPNASAKLAINSLQAQTPEGGAKRQALSYLDKHIEVAMNVREVDSGFDQVRNLVDPEKDLLASLKGFRETDFRVKWLLFNTLKLDLFTMDSHSAFLEEDGKIRNLALNWRPRQGTEIGYVRMEQQRKDPLEVLFAQMTERIVLAHDFGRLGAIRYMKEQQNFDGSEAKQPDMKKEFLAYETKLNDKTSVRTEQTRTHFEDGGKEHISANTISTELGPRVGVSLTDVKIDRGGERDEKKRNYGFWLDLGNGMRINYGYNRHIDGPGGTQFYNIGVTPGQIGGIKIDEAMYDEKRWDGVNTQGMSKLSIATAKPFDFAFFRDMSFSVGADMASDRMNWVRENQHAKVETRIGSNLLGLEYRSQIHQSGYRGVDRTIKFATDKDETRPLRASIEYKMRDLPTSDPIMIRNIELAARPFKNFEISNEIITNPEERTPRNDVLLGTVTSPWRINRWNFKYLGDANTSFAARWEERMNEQTRESSRIAGVNLDLFKSSGSPLSLFYGVEQKWGNVQRMTAHRYYLRFDQKPGPNQLFSIFAGNVSYEHSIAEGFSRNNWTVHVNYQLRF
jgi:hypothetical protein